MRIRDVAANVGVAVAIGCALISTFIAVRREMFPARAEATNAPKPQPIPVAHAERYQVGGHRIGSDAPALTVVEFIDFECPYCRKLAIGALKASMDRHPDVAVIVRQTPMPYHRFALPAARAAECAAEQGRFAQFYAVAFALQDSLGLQPFTAFARRAGVPDIERFEACTSLSTPIPGLAQDIAAADTLRVHATPSLVIDGMLIAGTPDSATLEKYIVAALGRQHRN